MGVSGSGKTEVGRRLAGVLAGVLGGEFFDADAYHPAANVAKMSAGIPLTDDDRRPWFERLAREIIAPCPEGATRVLACSALKKTYRDWLRAARPGAVRFVHLDGSFVGIEPPVDEVVRLVVSRLSGPDHGPVLESDHGPVVTSSPGA
jgi:gluconokinase